MSGAANSKARGRLAMRILSAILLAAAALLAVFAYWGIYTAQGRAAYDEMAGMVPFFAGVASLPLALAALVAFWLGRRGSAR